MKYYLCICLEIWHMKREIRL